ncbi:SDR family oxidoreductase [Pseudomonas yamanorum]|uniref:SDR family NAD(P)-dependent oxidoreductase n=1 Tax=Pseudomonas yamanorum TaxID=515393 RepID=UPI00159F9592|nr:SDR family oxidoreductase [Pseudomonas yamanorum]NWD25702.1 SDR family oxidoreductase [Pseudomonas yamanorum]
MIQIPKPRARYACFNDKHVLISGGGKGMGRAAALLFAQQGARVSILDRDEQASQETIGAIRELGGKASFHKINVSDVQQIDVAIGAAVAEFGSINHLFNHAGVVTVGHMHEMTEKDFQKIFDINVKSAFFVCKNIVSRMSAAGGGSIVITSSISGEHAFPLECLYNMTKSATIMLTKSLCSEYRTKDIRSNTISPAFVRTQHGLKEIEDFAALGQAWDESSLKATQLRICEPEEAAEAVLFLASDAASFINGQVLTLDNGWFA